jgi:hypothetical protein
MASFPRPLDLAHAAVDHDFLALGEAISIVKRLPPMNASTVTPVWTWVSPNKDILQRVLSPRCPCRC